MDSPLTLLSAFLLFSLLHPSLAGLLSQPNTIPAHPLRTDSTSPCHLDLSDELFGGLTEACAHTLDRSRCCPVLAAWLYAAHSRAALQLPAPISPSSNSDTLPMMPESDSQKCVASLQTSLQKRNIQLPQPNSTCDTVLCFCGIRLHQIASLTCPATFNMTTDGNNTSHRNATPTANVRNLENSCRNSSYSGCTKCLGALDKLNTGSSKNKTKSDSSRASRMLNKDCKLMGLTWLLARNKTIYIPTVSAVLRAMMYTTHPNEFKCSPDHQNMPLAVDSLQFHKTYSSTSSPSSISYSLSLFSLHIIMLLLNYNL